MINLRLYICFVVYTEKQKKEAASPSAPAQALGEEGFHKKQPTFFPECLEQALGEEDFY
jgi:hypothetical protein